MAERRPWQRGAYGRAAPIVGRRVWQSGLCGRVARMPEWPK